MVLRVVFAHRLTSLATFVLMAIVVAGGVVVSGFSRLANVSAASAAVLVVLGVVAISAQAAEVTRRRAAEVGLARLRGLGGVRLVAFAVAGQLTVVVAGALVGLGAGDLITRWAVRSWLSHGAAFSMSAQEWEVAAGLVVLVSIAVMVSSWSGLRRPLASALAADRRPGQRPVLMVFGELLVVVAALVALYEAHQPVSAGHDWVPLVSPVVVGLAAGQVVVWLLNGAFARARGRSVGARSLGWFLTVRRLGCRASSITVLRTVVGAGVVLAVAFCALSAATQWRVDRARLQAGGPVSYPVPDGAVPAYAAAVKADPQGRWLMPMVTFEDPTDQGGRRVFVSADRWDRVVGGFFAGTSAAGVSDQVGRLASGSSTPLHTASTLTVSIRGAPLRATPGAPAPRVVVRYIDGRGNLDSAGVTVPTSAHGAPAGTGPLTLHGRVTGCATACTVSSVGFRGFSHGWFDVTSLRFGSTSLLAPRSGGRVGSGLHLTAQRVGDGVRLNVPYGGGLNAVKRFLSFSSTGPVPVLATDEPELGATFGGHTVEGLDGRNRVTRIEGRVAALPFVGTHGVLLDLSTAITGMGPAVPLTQAYVIARADTPDSVLAALRRTGLVQRPSQYSARLAALDRTPRAEGLRLYQIVALGAGLIALVYLICAVVAQLRDRRLEAASLRVVGVTTSQVGAAYRREALILGLSTFVGTALASWAACRGLLTRLPLVSGWAFAPAVDASPRLATILVTAAILGLVVGAVALLAFWRIGASSPPRMLREGSS